MSADEHLSTAKLRARDEMENNLIASGGLFGLLLVARADDTLTHLEIVTDDQGNATNQIDIGLDFMRSRSRYRLTVERIPDEDLSGQQFNL